MYCRHRPIHVKTKARTTLRQTVVAPPEDTSNESSAFISRSAMTRSRYTFRDHVRVTTATRESAAASRRAAGSTEISVMAAADMMNAT